MSDQFYKEVFEVTALAPGIWVQFARRLKYAADLLFEQYRRHFDEIKTGVVTANPLDLSLQITSTLLYGFAFENILKAVLVQQDQLTVEGGRLAKWPGGGHDLVALAKAAEIRIEPQHFQLINRLSAFVVWAGRYPVPLFGDKMFVIQLSTEGKFPPEPIQPEEKESLDSLFAFLHTHVTV